MDCKKVQALIMTDFIDGEINKQLLEELRVHLNDCSQCRQFEQILREEAVEPFKQARRLKPPESLWFSIREIIGSEQKKGIFAALKERMAIRDSLRIKVMATATLMAVIFTTIFFSQLVRHKQNISADYSAQEITFISYLDTDLVSSDDNINTDFGTTIEEFFL